MANEQESAEDQFRSSLNDVIIILKKLSPLCKTVDELVELAELALNNDAQLGLLMQQVAPIQMRR